MAAHLASGLKGFVQDLISVAIAGSGGMAGCKGFAPACADDNEGMLQSLELSRLRCAGQESLAEDGVGCWEFQVQGALAG